MQIPVAFVPKLQLSVRKRFRLSCKLTSALRPWLTGSGMRRVYYVPVKHHNNVYYIYNLHIYISLYIQYYPVDSSKCRECSNTVVDWNASVVIAAQSGEMRCESVPPGLPLSDPTLPLNPSNRPPRKHQSQGLRALVYNCFRSQRSLRFAFKSFSNCHACEADF